VSIKSNNKEGPKITTLSNSHYYGIDNVFIMIGENTVKPYRLIVIHDNVLLFDCSYSTIRGARISFSRKYKEKAYDESTTAIWTHDYNADPVMFQRVMEIIKGI
jgi:hypothetical protein